MLERIFSIFLCLVSTIIFYSANNFDMSFIGNDGLGPDFFPKIISIILFGLSLMMLFESLREKKEISKINISLNTMKVIVLYGIYIFFITKLGYLTSTILFTFSIISILKKDDLILKVGYSLLFPIGLYLLFTYAFKVSLPVGLLI